jgi:hypothetical protein
MFPADPEPDLVGRYPAPPAVPWWVLFIVLLIINITCLLYLPKAIVSPTQRLVFETWGVYLCFWIRDLNPRATSIYWTLGAFFCEAANIFLKLLQDPTSLVVIGILVSSLLSVGFVITSIFVIRSELQKHYTDVEPFHLSLGGGMTLLFSYIYFQYHLYDIAVSKKATSRSLAT